jgi:methionyl aminopeptidase
MLIRLKSAAEIEGFAKAGKIAAAILEAVLAEAKPGTITGELDELAQRLCTEHGVKPAFLGYRGFPGAICTSINEEVVHGIPGPRALEEGDILSVDIGTDLDGFIGDTARTIVVGGMPSDLVRCCETALHEAVRAAQPGGRLSAVGEAIAKTARSGGFAVVEKYGGHGIDRGRLHADPFIWNRIMRGFDEDVELRPGMILAIEPMLVEGGSGDVALLEDGWTVAAGGNAAHFEYTVAIVEAGCRVLTQAPEANPPFLAHLKGAA